MKESSKTINKFYESWAPIKGLERYFLVSNYGKIISLSRIYPLGKHKLPCVKPERELTNRIVRGYYYVMLEVSDGRIKIRRNIRVARLVASHFIRKPKEKEQVNHIDGNRLNDRADNLEWVSCSENMKHAFRLGLMPLPKGRMKFSRIQIEKVRKLRKKGLLHRSIAQTLGMGTSTVTHILLGSRRSKQ